MKIGLRWHFNKHKVTIIKDKLLQIFHKHNFAITMLDKPDISAAGLDLIFVIGGDGTFLNAAHLFAQYGVPFIVINAGQLGFLSTIDSTSANLEEFIESARCIKELKIERRLMLKAEIIRQNKTVDLGAALNDICIIKDPLGRMIKCNVKMDELPLGTYSGDGVLVATPTGSTAYSLSCGGPLVAPEMEILLLTPICPHMLSVRPLVLPSTAQLSVQVSRESYGMHVVVDGQLIEPLESGDIVKIYRTDYDVFLVKSDQLSFFELIQNKFRNKSFAISE